MMDSLKDLAMRAGHVLDWLRRAVKPGGVDVVDMSRIEDGLYLGGFFTRWPDGTDAVLNVAEEDTDPQGPEGCRELHVPLYDLPPAPGPEQLHSLVLVVSAWRLLGLTVLVHCDAGFHRSATVVIAYLMFLHSWNADDAIVFVARKRPGARPHDFQRDALVTYQAWLVSQKTKV